MRVMTSSFAVMCKVSSILQNQSGHVHRLKNQTHLVGSCMPLYADMWPSVRCHFRKRSLLLPVSSQ